LISRANAAYLEQIYAEYVRDPLSVDKKWAQYFTALDAVSGNGSQHSHHSPIEYTLTRVSTRPERNIGVFDLIHSYRGFGHLVARLDPLGRNTDFHPYLDPAEFGFDASDLERVVECPTFKNCTQAKLSDLIDLLKLTYCDSLGVEYMEIFDKEKRSWLQGRMEPDLNKPSLSVADRQFIHQRLTCAESFEQYVHTKFVGQKRFSLEGGESLIPLLDFMIEAGADIGVEEVVVGMAHRGRLNVLAHVLNKPYHLIFSEFEGAFLPADIQGDGDVKYHLGYSHNQTTRAGQSVHLSLASNPSHLEAVNPVVQGIVRAKQNRLGDFERARVVPILIHGDASFTGQGIVSETLALSELDAYRTGGTIHIIINNQIGFTTSPKDYRFTRYPSDTAKEIQAPVFHVNGDDPEAAVQAARLAVAYRDRFKADVIIDLVCYRRHGHNEADDPTFTQPVLYEKIRAHKTSRELYEEQLLADGDTTNAEIDAFKQSLRKQFDEELNYARDFLPRQRVQALGGWWKSMHWAGTDWGADTKLPLQTLERIVDGVLTVPQGFTIHPKVAKILAERAKMIQPGGRLDWACAEMLAVGSILLEGHRVRLAGQDSGRGTFSHRHAALTDIRTSQRHVSLDHLSSDQGRFVLIDTMLSEAAVLGFEYGFSTADPDNLVIWEAQFGDFANGAQVIIDQFIVSGESKWQRMSGLVMLLPHGYEGQGPEHSSARLERFLQMCADNNLQVCNLTTPAQYFHAIRRQIHREFRKPLIVMTPKSLLRNKLCTSDVAELTEGTFQPVLDETEHLDRNAVQRLLFCTGKIYFELLTTRSDCDITNVAIVRVEQLYPFPADELTRVIATFPNATEAFWVQEEPANMGAWSDIERRFRSVLPERIPFLAYAGRRAAASPATGNYKLHRREGESLIDYALRKPYAR